MRQLTRYHPEVANACCQHLLIEAGALHENPYKPDRQQDGIGHPRRADSRQFVAERNHAFSFSSTGEGARNLVQSRLPAALAAGYLGVKLVYIPRTICCGASGLSLKLHHTT